jgi:hypothetical protein
MSSNLKGSIIKLLLVVEFSSFQILNIREPEEKISRDDLPFGNVYSFVYSFVYLFDGVYCKLKLAAVKFRPISSIRTFNFQTFSRSGLYHKHCKKKSEEIPIPMC